MQWKFYKCWNCDDKEKKPRSDAQKAATVKALAALKERREKMEQESKEIKESKVLAKEKTRDRKKKDLDNPVVTKKMLDDVLKQHVDEIKKAKEPQVSTLPSPPKPVASAAPVADVPVADAPVADAPAPVPRPASAASAAPRPTTLERQRLTGRELLDKIFFS